MALGIYVIGVAIVVTVMLSSYFLGARGKGHCREHPYESGVKSSGDGDSRFFAHYFLVAILFVIFDLESVFLYVWASVVREASWAGLLQITFFIAMLVLGLIYAISMGILRVFKPYKREVKSS